MEIDFRGYEAGLILADVCIVGAGAAGIALACALRGSGRDVLLVESGDVDRTDAADMLLQGETVGPPFTGLVDGRARAFGGATRLWFGQCIRLDSIDYERRAWVPRSGWPVTEPQLAPYYDKAERFLGIARPIYDHRLWSRFGVSDPAFSPDRIAPKFTIYCPQPDFKIAYRALLRSNPTVRVLLNATVTQLNVSSDGGIVHSADLSSLSGRRGVVQANTFVLCGGGIENPRLMLASRKVMANGVGNGRDLVGRFFQDHPTGRTAAIKPANSRKFQMQFGMLRRGRVRYWPKLALAPQLQARLGVLNANSYPVYDYPEAGGVNELKAVLTEVKAHRFGAPFVQAASATIRIAPQAAWEGARWALRGRAPVFKPSGVSLQVHLEQAPDPDSRVALSDRLDPLGVPEPKILWRIGELERRTLKAVVQTVSDELHRLGLAEMEAEPWLDQFEDSPSCGLNDAFHHAGTTRMAASSSQGVVDTDCRVHGVGNLYVAGGSVFPTSGYANPTLTIIALAIRLADHLAG